MKFNAAFWKWFGDSKVVDAKGVPLVVYHGSALPMSKKDGSWHEIESQLFVGGDFKSFDGKLFYFATNPSYASEFAQAQANIRRYGNNAFVIPAYLRIENPLDWREYKRAWEELRSDGNKIRENLLKNGKDGVMMYESDPRERAGLVFVAFKPTQVKSATGNDGTWDADDPDIRSNPPDGAWRDVEYWYHGTSSKFDEFKTPAYFSSDPRVPGGYKGERGYILKVKLDIRNPLVENVHRRIYWEGDVRPMLKAGHDAMIQMTRSGSRIDAVVLHPEMVEIVDVIEPGRAEHRGKLDELEAEAERILRRLSKP